jgi:hypothetical protein
MRERIFVRRSHSSRESVLHAKLEADNRTGHNEVIRRSGGGKGIVIERRLGTALEPDKTKLEKRNPISPGSSSEKTTEESGK